MATILFPNADNLRLAIASGAIPSSVAQAPARLGIDAQGRYWVEPSVTLPRFAASALTRLGALVQGTAGAPLTDSADRWAFLLPLQRLSESRLQTTSSPVLFDFVVPALVPSFVADIRRLGAGEIGVAGIGVPKPRTLLLVTRVPYPVLLRAQTSPDAGVRVFARQRSNVWVEFGYEHPLADQIAPPAGQMALLTTPRRCEWLPEPSFTNESEPLPTPRSSGGLHSARDMEWRLPTQLRLVPSRDSDPPGLLVLPAEAFDQLQQFAQYSDDRLLARLRMGVGSIDGQQVAVIVGSDPNGPLPPMVLPGARPYRSVLRLPNLFAPCGLQLRPPLRRDVLRQWFAPDPQQIAWLAPTHSGGWDRNSLPIESLRPLAESVQYQAPRPLAPIESEALQSPWSPAPYSIGESKPAPPPRRVPPAPPSRQEDPPAPEAESAEGWIQKLAKWFTPRFGRGDEPRTPAERSQRPTLPASLEPAPAPMHAWERRRREIESRLLSTEVVDEERRDLWPELAGLCAAVNESAEAAACWLHALWDDPIDGARWARGWLAAEARGPNPESELERWLSGPPSPAVARAVAAFTVWAAGADHLPAELSSWLVRAQRVLDEYETSLPVRAAWLGRLALNQLIGGDPVGLARCRDRLLGRLLDSGLSADLDVPRFVRFAGQVSGERRQEVRNWLMRAREPMRRWIAQSGGPGSPDLRLPQFGLGSAGSANGAYVDLILAWGIARLGERATSQEWIAAARAALPSSDTVHSLLSDAYALRARQALEGLAHRGPLPSDWRRRRAALMSIEGASEAAFKIDRLRQYSRILEPQEHIRAFDEGDLSSSTPLRELDDRGELEYRLTDLLTAEPKDIPATLAIALDLAPRVGETFALSALDRLMAVVDRWGFRGHALQVETELAAFERGWFVAVHFDRPETVRRLLTTLVRILQTQRQAGSESLAAEDAFLDLVSQSLRGLRRLGLRPEADRLLDHLREWAQPAAADIPRLTLLRRRLHLAGGWFYVGADLDATTALDDARLVLFSGRLTPKDQVPVACAYAHALGYAPIRMALGRVEEIFQRLQNVHDQFSTNTHFSLARLRVVESAVLAVVNDDFALGPAVRRWLDDDEFRVRQRIHRDVLEATRLPH